MFWSYNPLNWVLISTFYIVLINKRQNCLRWWIGYSVKVCSAPQANTSLWKPFWVFLSPGQILRVMICHFSSFSHAKTFIQSSEKNVFKPFIWNRHNFNEKREKLASSGLVWLISDTQDFKKWMTEPNLFTNSTHGLICRTAFVAISTI